MGGTVATTARPTEWPAARSSQGTSCRFVPAVTRSSFAGSVGALSPRPIATGTECWVLKAADHYSLVVVEVHSFSVDFLVAGMTNGPASLNWEHFNSRGEAVSKRE